MVSCCSIFSFLWSVLQTVNCHLFLFILIIMLSILLRLTDSDHPFGFFKLFYIVVSFYEIDNARLYYFYKTKILNLFSSPLSKRLTVLPLNKIKKDRKKQQKKTKDNNTFNTFLGTIGYDPELHCSILYFI